MKTAIIYSTKHGGTARCVELVKNKLNGKADVYNIREQKNVPLDHYHQVIVGGSIYMGQIQKEVKAFCQKKLNTLLDKKTALFICSAFGAEEEFASNFPVPLINKSEMNVNPGYVMDMGSLTFMEKMMAKAIPKSQLRAEGYRGDRIQALAGVMNQDG